MKKVNRVVIVKGWHDTYYQTRNTEELDNLLEGGWEVVSVHTPMCSSGGETSCTTVGDVVFVLSKKEFSTYVI